MKTKKKSKATTPTARKAVAQFKVEVPGTVRITKKGDHAEIVVFGCNIDLSDEKLGIDLKVTQR